MQSLSQFSNRVNKFGRGRRQKSMQSHFFTVIWFSLVPLSKNETRHDSVPRMWNGDSNALKDHLIYTLDFPLPPNDVCLLFYSNSIQTHTTHCTLFAQWTWPAILLNWFCGWDLDNHVKRQTNLVGRHKLTDAPKTTKFFKMTMINLH